ncbi:MAG: hypothetical protein DWQ08_09865 [Proteobacteria bacterium]|nr:MAG: hypothetical protein DWQ08_09865 [Pseudomonadota bacterium]
MPSPRGNIERLVGEIAPCHLDSKPAGLFILEQKLEILASRVDELIETVRALRRDNHKLKARETELNEEKERLKAKNLEAKDRLETIISRLRQQGGEQS